MWVIIDSNDTQESSSTIFKHGCLHVVSLATKTWFAVFYTLLLSLIAPALIWTAITTAAPA